MCGVSEPVPLAAGERIQRTESPIATLVIVSPCSRITSQTKNGAQLTVGETASPKGNRTTPSGPLTGLAAKAARGAAASAAAAKRVETKRFMVFLFNYELVCEGFVSGGLWLRAAASS